MQQNFLTCYRKKSTDYNINIRGAWLDPRLSFALPEFYAIV